MYVMGVPGKTESLITVLFLIMKNRKTKVFTKILQNLKLYNLKVFLSVQCPAVGKRTLKTYT